MKQQKLHIKSKSVVVLALIVLGLSTWSSLSYAVSDSVNFDVKVTIVTKTCEVNNNNPITVEFNDMIINKIKDGIYEQPIPYTLDCGEAPAGQLLRLQFIGAGAFFDNTLLQTSERDLGLQFKKDGKDFDLNTWQNFTYTNTLPSLSVLAVASLVGGIDDGEFTATATFNVEYQ
ncbi:fimbrial protein [Klebsiella sp. BIGb0407]|uniref:fimbrial protein n=1 Tax=Klebsiella sp. BIGb0407 TaxID=2940603 RepID=UPI002169479E|nr:fimbrial protein [Klebsiella sp. BIGb0407]MCS3433874.1 type 1 fimbria pilin [Klebsiella sp. BIGb0407]